jgi:NitT/TauT family transport system substrate-binding protein
MFKKLLPLLAFGVLVILWEFTSNQWGNHRLVLPSPSSILGRIIQTPERFLFHTKVTFFEMIGGFVFAFLVAFPLAWMMDQWESARDILQPLFVIVQCIPMFALAPIMVIWFGWSYAAIVVPTTLMIFFPLTMNIYQGFRSTPDYLKDYFRVHQATQTQLLFKLQLPWAKSHIFAGFRIAAAIAGIGAVAGEWAGAQAGLGLLMIESRRATDLETTFGALFCLATMSLSLYGLITLLEKKVFTRCMHAKITANLL